ncbi:acetyl-CoA C-acetyltransferase [Sandaracinobacteroides saxicola]|uniref:Acetyl-CoA C-acetyltransferase n=1 Tax=Sandaracinobacteroides saxicola TaxID=2759707 RepID=A0A7G5IHU3_9SPHN|nr:acetyl-CoA C-acetyltransferase [Sandaracinobacteroides saxicola]QMW22935.1 acetyl-CoA C-acetyltransferase [Sandaracinobacteroides saxicola]
MEAYIVAATRTAGGRKGGRLRDWHPADLAAAVLDELVARAGADPAQVEDVIMGCVSQFGQQAVNIARNAVMASSLPESVPGTSVDRQCGSSQQALHFAAQAVMSGSMDMVIAAGVESMTRVPMGIGGKLAHDAGLGMYVSPNMKRRYPNVQFSQFTGAEMIAAKYDLSKDAMDEFGFHSQAKGAAAARSGAFDKEILPLKTTTLEGVEELHTVDEGIRFEATLEATKAVKLLAPEGRLTAATSSQICDGASGVLVVNERGLKALNVAPLARVHHMTVIGEDPVIMLEAPFNATKKALAKAGMTIDDIDLFEVNEAFASVPMGWLQSTGADPAKLNVNGGAIALGHPLGASGTKLMTTLVHALQARGLRWGLQTMCEGGGLANVTIVEAL